MANLKCDNWLSLFYSGHPIQAVQGKPETWHAAQLRGFVWLPKEATCTLCLWRKNYESEITHLWQSGYSPSCTKQERPNWWVWRKIILLRATEQTPLIGQIISAFHDYDSLFGLNLTIALVQCPPDTTGSIVKILAYDFSHLLIFVPLIGHFHLLKCAPLTGHHSSLVVFTGQ